MKKIILGMMLVFMSIFVTPCRGAVSSSNSEALGHDKPQESNERGNTASEEDDFLGAIVLLVGGIFIFRYISMNWDKDWDISKY